MEADRLIAYIISTLEDQGDRAFMENLYQDFERLMFSTARRYVQAIPDQKDIVQDAMEKLIKKSATIRSMNRCALACYIVYTIRSTSIDFLRARNKSVEHNVSIDLPESSELEAVAPSMDDLAISAERMALLQSLWPHLPEDDRTLLEGKYVWGYTDQELASLLKCKPSSIRMKLTRARRRAFEQMTEKEGVIG